LQARIARCCKSRLVGLLQQVLPIQRAKFILIEIKGNTAVRAQQYYQAIVADHDQANGCSGMVLLLVDC
jgi:hypothetical protein